MIEVSWVDDPSSFDFWVDDPAWVGVPEDVEDAFLVVGSGRVWVKRVRMGPNTL